MASIVVSLNQANLSASTKTSNLLANTELANVPSDDMYEVEVYAVSSASGVNIIVQSAGETLINDKEIIGIGTTLSENDHLIGTFEVQPNAPLQLTLRETSASATTDVLLKIVATPMGAFD